MSLGAGAAPCQLCDLGYLTSLSPHVLTCEMSIITSILKRWFEVKIDEVCQLIMKASGIQYIFTNCKCDFYIQQMQLRP